MKYNIFIFGTLVAMVSLTNCAQFDPEETYNSYLTDYPGDQLVVEGVLSPEGIYVRVGKTQPPNLPFNTNDIQVSGATRVLLYDLESGDTMVLTHNALSGAYSLNQSIPTNASYGVKVTSVALPELTIEPLEFTSPLTFADVRFHEDDNDGFVLTSRTLFEPNQFVMLQPLVEDSLTVRSASLLLDLDELYLNQCGFNFDMPILSYPNTCFALDTAILIMQHASTPIGADRFTRPGNGPQRIGIRIGSISARDYRFFTGLAAPNSFIEAYLTEQPLADYELDGGFGRIIVLNGEAVWKDI
jgi:hypothetical protein